MLAPLNSPPGNTNSSLSRERAAALLSTFPTVVGPVTGAVVGIVAAGLGGALDEVLEDKVRMGPLKPSGLLAIGLGAVALAVDSPDWSAFASSAALGLSAPAVYDAARGGIQRSRQAAQAAKAAQVPKAA